MNWNKECPPPHGVAVLLKFTDGSVHEGHFIKHCNKYQKNVNRYRVYKTGKTVEMTAVKEWGTMPE